MLKAKGIFQHGIAQVGAFPAPRNSSVAWAAGRRRAVGVLANWSPKRLAPRRSGAGEILPAQVGEVEGHPVRVAVSGNRRDSAPVWRNSNRRVSGASGQPTSSNSPGPNETQQGGQGNGETEKEL